MNIDQDLECKNCGRYLGKAYGTVVAELKCSNSACKATNQFKIVQADNTKDITYKFLKPEQPPKTKQAEVS